MRRILTVWITLVCCALVMAQTLLVWNSTGRAGFTRLPDPSRAARSADAASVADLFADTGLGGDADVRVSDVPNEFALGLLPSTYPWRIWDAHLASVVTIGVPAALIGLIAASGPRPHRGRGGQASS